MIRATATASANSAFHHTAACSHAAAPVPATTGATAFGSVRGRAPDTHWAKLATRASCPMHHNERMLGVIGGSGFYTFFGPDIRHVSVDTPYGGPSAPITVGAIGDHEVAFLPRHGAHHEYPAHTVPYRANMWALRTLGVRRIFAPCAVGSLTAELGPGTVVVPDQLVDRTTGRADTYFDSSGIHVGFADPYCPTLRAAA